MIINGIELQTKRVPNYIIFNAKVHVPEPQVPKYYLEEYQRFEENPSHPVYHDAMQTYSILKSSARIDEILYRGVEVDSNLLQDEVWKKTYKNLQQALPNIKSEFVAYLRYYLFNSDEDIEELIDSIVLTYNRVQNIIDSVSITRNGENIHRVHLKNSVNTHISFEQINIGTLVLVNPMDEFQACESANIPFNQWIAGELSIDEMACTVAMYKIKELYDTHTSDAVQIASEQKSKPK